MICYFVLYNSQAANLRHGHLYAYPVHTRSYTELIRTNNISSLSHNDSD